MKNILVIDDDIPILEVMKILLEDCGYQVTTANNVDDAKKYLKKQIPDLIFIDVSINGKSGCDITRQLKAGIKTKHIPIIILSANSGVKDLAEEAGADDFLPKPFDIQDLTVKVSRYLS